MIDDHDALEPDDLPPSRSQRKRDHQALQALVRELVGLPRATLDTLPISESLRAELDAAKRLVPKALNREIRHLARQLANADPDALRAVVDRHHQPHRDAVNALHRAERLRDQLLAGDGDGLQALIDRHPDVDRQQVRQWLRAAARESGQGAPPKSARKLFKYLHALETAQLSGGDVD